MNKINFDSIANLFHYQGLEHLSIETFNNWFYFKNIKYYDHEANILFSRNQYHDLQNCLIHCFSSDSSSLVCNSSWIEYGYKKWKAPICLGYRETNLRTNSCVSGPADELEYQSEYIIPYHTSVSKEKVFSCGVKYGNSEDIIRIKKTIKIADDVDFDSNTFILTFENEGEKQLRERRFLIRGAEPTKWVQIQSVKLTSIFLAPLLSDVEIEKVLSIIPDKFQIKVFSMNYDSNGKIEYEQISQEN